ncbi:MAG: polysaccharide deacetylase family protein [Terriglobales bacterium]
MLKPAFRRVAQAAFHGLGGIDWVRYRNRNAPRVLIYHRFSSGSQTFEPQLKKQCEHLRKHYHPISELQLREWLLEGRSLPSNAVLLTIDDGYADFATVAVPILSYYQIPSLVFVVSDFIDSKIWLWWDIIFYSFLHTCRARIDLTIADRQLSFTISSSEERRTAAMATSDLLIRVTNSDRLGAINQLVNVLGVEIPRLPTVDYSPMTWQQIEHATSQGVSVGGHTCTHPILTSLRNQQAVLDEIAGGKRRIEEKLRRPVSAFAYPNGQEADVDDSVVDAVRRAGFDVAFVARAAMLAQGDDPLQLCRIPAGFYMSDFYFRQQVAGFRRSGAGTNRGSSTRTGAHEGGF